jgi:hypothetical protein
MKYTVDMISGAMLHIPNFIKIGSDIQNLTGVGFTDIQGTWRSYNINSFFFKMRKIC